MTKAKGGKKYYVKVTGKNIGSVMITVKVRKKLASGKIKTSTLWFSTDVWGDEKQRAKEAFELQNAVRRKAGQKELEWSEELYKIAVVRVKNDGFDSHQNFHKRWDEHFSIDGITPDNIEWGGENLYIGSANPADAIKSWSLETLPFIPQEFKYEVIPAVAKQFGIVSGLLNRKDVERIYVCTDSGREGEYIYRLVEQQANVKGKERRRVWIDSQTEDEILRGIREAKDLKEYDNLSASAYLRAKEDYLMGINFSRLLTLKYGNSIANYLKTDRSVVSVGMAMFACCSGIDVVHCF